MEGARPSSSGANKKLWGWGGVLILSQHRHCWRYREPGTEQESKEWHTRQWPCRYSSKKGVCEGSHIHRTRPGEPQQKLQRPTQVLQVWVALASEKLVTKEKVWAIAKKHNVATFPVIAMVAKELESPVGYILLFLPKHFAPVRARVA